MTQCVRARFIVEIDSREARIQTQKSGAGLVEMNGGLDEVDRKHQSRRVQPDVPLKPIVSLLPLPSVDTNSCSTDNRSVRRNLTRCEPGMKLPMLKLKVPGECVQSLEAKRRQALARIEQAKADVAGSQVYSSLLSHCRPH